MEHGSYNDNNNNNKANAHRLNRFLVEQQKQAKSQDFRDGNFALCVLHNGVSKIYFSALLTNEMRSMHLFI